MQNFTFPVCGRIDGSIPCIRMLLRFAVRLPSSVFLSRMGETAVSGPFFQNRIGGVEFLCIMDRSDSPGIRMGHMHELAVSFFNIMDSCSRSESQNPVCFFFCHEFCFPFCPKYTSADFVKKGLQNKKEQSIILLVRVMLE